MLDFAFQAVFALIFVALVLIFQSRILIGSYIHHTLNCSNRRKRWEKSNFWEWLFYKNFKDIIPKRLFVWYYFNFIVPVVIVPIIIVIGIYSTNEIIIRCIVSFYFVPSILLYLIGYLHVRKKWKKH